MSDLEEKPINGPLDVLGMYALEKRPDPKKMDNNKIKLPKREENIIENLEESEENVNEKKEMDDPETTQPTKKMVVDKTKENMINRYDALKKIRNKMNVEILDKTSKPDKIIVEEREKIPTNTGKQLLINEDMEDRNDDDDDTNNEERVLGQVDEEVQPNIEIQEEFEINIPVIQEQEEVKTKKPRKKGKMKIVPDAEDISDVDLTTAMIRTQKVADRLPKEREKIVIKAPSYYMNNRKIFTQKLTELFKPYQKEILDNQENASCDQGAKTRDFDLLTHQKIVRDYLNLYTPYRGLLLYHGLGSGKTCTSIAIAEGMKSNKRVFVMTPASLKMNFFSEMKKCGDDLYKKNQYWEFISIDGNPDYVGILAKSLSLSTNYIHDKGGAWLVNIQKEANYETLETEEQRSLDDQLNEMIRTKYTDINYNGMNENKMKLITGNYTNNPFDNAVVVIDEAHNFVSRIVNKLNKPKSISYRLYDYLMSANNAKIVFLTGTPIINYPNEISVLYNMLRGYITSFTIPLKWEKKEKLNTDTILTILDKENMKTFDMIEFSDGKLTITRNPFGFVNTKKRGQAKGTKRAPKPKVNKTKKENNDNEENDDEQVGGGNELFEKYNGVKLDDSGNITDKQFVELVVKALKKNGIEVNEKQIQKMKYKCLPDVKDEFIDSFVDEEEGTSKNLNLFQRRILGLTSYFRSAQEELLPSFVKTENDDIYHVEKLEMTDHQFSIYEKIRKTEHEKEKNKNKMQRKKKKNEQDLFDISSTYRIFSRAACNFAFPPAVDRPVPNLVEEAEIDEAIVDAVNPTQQEYGTENDEKPFDTNKEEENYNKRIQHALELLNKDKENSLEKEYLSKESLPLYSPKFAKILENIQSGDNDGLHLLYSHFRTLEGIGILRLVLLANGFAEFKLKRVGATFELDENEEDRGKPKFVLYTGTETPEEKEIIRNVYNSMWEYVPSSITEKLKEINENNHMGEIIKLIMITSSGAEGINLRNTRFVHIVEPYWHMVRVEQVVGRARRICSHQDLPEEKRNVKVYLYVSTLSEEQKKDDSHIELLIRDVSRLDKKTPITTDENLYELSSVKQKINNQILNAIKESAVDCNLYSNTSKSKEDQLVCYGFGKVESNAFSSYPSFERDTQSKSGLDTKKINWKGVVIKENDTEYVLNKGTNEVYDYASYKRALELGTELIKIGKLIKQNGKMIIDRNI